MSAFFRYLLVFSALLLLNGSPHVAADQLRGVVRYTPALVETLEKNNRGYLLIFTATWCPTCKYQLKLLKKLLNETEFSGVPVVEADFDHDEGLKDELQIRRQGTIIVRQGARELQREVLARDEEALRVLLRAAQGQKADPTLK